MRFIIDFYNDVLVKFPFSQRLWALPVLAALYRSKEWNQRHGRRHKTPAQLMRQLLTVLMHWFPQRKFVFAGDGGFGKMYRQAGFDPSPFVCREGFLTRIAGKIYMDASLGPEMFFEGFPFKYDIEQLRKNPDAAQNPPTIPVGGLTTRMKMAHPWSESGQP